jgi:hypothetical protein
MPVYTKVQRRAAISCDSTPRRNVAEIDSERVASAGIVFQQLLLAFDITGGR